MDPAEDAVDIDLGLRLLRNRATRKDGLLGTQSQTSNDSEEKNNRSNLTRFECF
jgi:hypothetical protein